MTDDNVHDFTAKRAAQAARTAQPGQGMAAVFFAVLFLILVEVGVSTGVVGLASAISGHAFSFRELLAAGFLLAALSYSVVLASRTR